MMHINISAPHFFITMTTFVMYDHLTLAQYRSLVQQHITPTQDDFECFSYDTNQALAGTSLFKRGIKIDNVLVLQHYFVMSVCDKEKYRVCIWKRSVTPSVFHTTTLQPMSFTTWRFSLKIWIGHMIPTYSMHTSYCDSQRKKIETTLVAVEWRPFSWLYHQFQYIFLFSRL